MLKRLGRCSTEKLHFQIVLQEPGFVARVFYHEMKSCRALRDSARNKWAPCAASHFHCLKGSLVFAALEFVAPWVIQSIIPETLPKKMVFV